MKGKLLCLILFLFHVHLAITSSNAASKLILDVLKSFDIGASSVVGKLCWQPAEVHSLWKMLVNSAMTLKLIDGANIKKTLPNDVFLVDVSCADYHDFLAEADKLHLFKRPNKWLMFGRSSNKILTQIINFNILLDSEVMIAESLDGHYDLFLIYKLSPPSEFTFEHYGIWTSHFGLRKCKSMSVPFWRRRQNLKSLPMKMSLVITHNSSKDNLDDTSNHKDSISKYGVRMLNALFSFLNVSQVIIFTDTWGYFINGSWNGMVSDLIEGRAEIGGTGLLYTAERLGTLDFLSDPMETSVAFVFRQPSLSYQNNIYFLPFDLGVWYCFFALIPIVLVVLYANAKWEREKYRLRTESVFFRKSVTDLMMMLTSIISQQGTSLGLKGSIGRVVMSILFITFTFLYSSYSANIVALLQARSTSIRSLSDLYNSRLELGVEDTPYSRHIFKTASDPLRRAIYAKVAPPKAKAKFMSIEEGVKRMQKSPFAFHMLTGTGYSVVERHFYEHEKCGLKEIPYFSTQTAWLSNRKGSPYHELFKIGLHRIREHGINERENKLMFARKPVCHHRGGSFDSVTIVEVYPAFLLLLYGVAIAFGLLLLEITVCKTRKRFTTCV